MLSLGLLQTLASGISYKPDWQIRIYETPHQGVWCGIRVDLEDSYNPGTTTPLSVKSPLPPLINSPDDFFKWLRWRLETIEIHECHEWLKYNGKVLFDPHKEGADEPKER